MKGGTQAKHGLEPIKCRYCATVFTPIREAQFTCGASECKKKNNLEYNRRTKDKEKDKNKMAEWRRLNPAKKILSNIKTRNNIDLDVAWIQERLDAGVCEATGISFQFPKYGAKAGFNHYPWNPSVDKIDPNGGYCKANCRMVVWAFNRAKGLWDDDIVIKLAKGVINGMVK